MLTTPNKYKDGEPCFHPGCLSHVTPSHPCEGCGRVAGIAKKYEIIYADPPWPERGGGKIKRGADRHYKLMQVKKIAELPISDIAADNCHLYLWVTNSHLQAGLDVMRAWGFRHKTTITWCKDKFGLGQYFRGQTEHCLFGVRGMIPYKTEGGKRQQGRTLFYSPRREHSRKPEEMRQMILKVSDRPGFNKIELFARERVEGWDAWGDELDADKIQTAGAAGPGPGSAAGAVRREPQSGEILAESLKYNITS